MMRFTAFLLTIFSLSFFPKVYAEEIPEVPDTVQTGIFITSIHDIDFQEKEYSINFWIWMKYKNKDLNFIDNIEIPQAKTFEKAFTMIDTSNGMVYLLMKMQCVMRDSWKIKNFPFDKQKLRLSVENAVFDAQSMVFVTDTLGENVAPRFAVSGWKINKLDISTGIRKYETNFGDPEALSHQTEYSSFRVRIELTRDAMDLFWKIFIGMYISFLIAYACSFIHDNIDSRFQLSVGALFAVVGNKYIVESSLPESTSFTLVDALHGLTLGTILFIVTFTVISLHLHKRGKHKTARRFDLISAQSLLLVYIALNIYFVYHARVAAA